MTAQAVPKQYDTSVFNKTCGECGKYSPKGLNLDLGEPKNERKWKCNRCFHKH